MLLKSTNMSRHMSHYLQISDYHIWGAKITHVYSLNLRSKNHFFLKKDRSQKDMFSG